MGVEVGGDWEWGWGVCVCVEGEGKWGGLGGGRCLWVGTVWLKVRVHGVGETVVWVRVQPLDLRERKCGAPAKF